MKDRFGTTVKIGDYIIWDEHYPPCQIIKIYDAAKKYTIKAGPLNNLSNWELLSPEEVERITEKEAFHRLLSRQYNI
jgi:hypothetical protein